MRLKTRNWIAHSWTNFAGLDPSITVIGEVQTTNSNQKLSLTKASPQGINPNILILTLTVKSEGIGADIVMWKHVGYHGKDAAQYDHVMITGDCDPDSVPVTPIIA